MSKESPSLFGLSNTNRDFSKKDSWGKNQFNSSFPDNKTCDLEEHCYGSEIVVRPDTIVYLACSLALNSKEKLSYHLGELIIDDWSDASQVLPHIESIVTAIEKLSLAIEKTQKPFLLQPIWKTKGKSPELADQCLDIFVWSDAGFSHFISKVAKKEPTVNKIDRQTRTAIWLYKMLKDFIKHGKFDHEEIIDKLSYNTKNDKAFASVGMVTNKYMTTIRLDTFPIIAKSEIKNIILGDGQNMLSPERRFDAIIFNSPDLFK